MNNNSVFGLLSSMAKMMNESDEYKPLDFTKKEDVEKLDNAIKTLKENEFFSNLFDNDLFDALHEKAHKIYDEAHPKKKIPARPQDTVSEDIKKNITSLAVEYMNTLILPNANLKENQVRDILNGLIDFGCWVYSK